MMCSVAAYMACNSVQCNDLGVSICGKTCRTAAQGVLQMTDTQAVIPATCFSGKACIKAEESDMHIAACKITTHSPRTSVENAKTQTNIQQHVSAALQLHSATAMTGVTLSRKVMHGPLDLHS